MSLAKPISGTVSYRGSAKGVTENLNRAKDYAADAAKMAGELSTRLSDPNLDVNGTLRNIDNYLTEARLLHGQKPTSTVKFRKH